MHKIIISDFKDCEIKTEIAGAYGPDDYKNLYVIINYNLKTVKFLVNNRKVNKAEYFQTLIEAVEFYNRY